MIEGAGAERRGTGEAATRSAARLALAGLIAVTAILLVLAPSAMAEKKFLFAGELPQAFNEEWHPSFFNNLLAESVAVNDKNDHIYVADSGRGAIFDYTSRFDKTPTRWNGSTTPAGSFGGEFLSVAVDNTTGDVYVADRTHAVVDKFDENGNLIATFGDSEPSHNGQLAGLGTPAKSFSPPAESYTSFPIAINQATHDLYVVDPGHKVIDIFDENGTYLSQITATPPGLYEKISGNTRTTGIAVTTAGNVYVADWAGHKIYQFNAANEYVSSWNGGTLPNGSASSTPEGSFGEGGAPLEVAAEDSTGHVFVNNWNFGTVDIFDGSGNYIQQVSKSEFQYPTLYGSEAVAIDQATGYIYSAGGSTVQILKPVIVPDVAITPASNLTPTSATLNGHVDPASGEGGGPITECTFEYLTVYEFAENGEQSPWRGARQAPCSPTPSSSPTDVSAGVTGLTQGTEYRFRLVAGNEEGSNSIIGQNFATVGPYGFSSEFGSTGSGDGQLDEPKDVAVNNSNGDVYVADAGNHRVDEFSSSGTFLRAFGADVGGAGVNVCTSGCQVGTPGTNPGQLTSPKFVEVDNSNDPSAGDVYVADGKESIVQKFDSSGNLIASWGNGGAIGFVKKEGVIGGITVNSLGSLYVLTDGEPYNWTEFSQDGVSVTKIPTDGHGWPLGIEFGTPGGSGIDVGPAETLYETRPSSRGSYGVSYSTVTAGIYETGLMYVALYGLELANSGLAVNRAANNVFVDQGSWIDEFEAAECQRGRPFHVPPGCKPSDSFGTGRLKSAAGLAIRPSTGLLYAANTGNDSVAVFSELPRAEVITGQAANVGMTSGTMTGHVDPGVGGQVNDCHFEYLAGNPTNEIQSIGFTQGTKEGTFTATFEGQTTKPAGFAVGNFTAELFQFRLEELSTIGAGNVRVTGEERGPFKIEFTGRFTELNVPQITTNSSGLVGPGAEAIPTTRYDGNGWSYSQNASCTPVAPFSTPTDVSAELTNLTPFKTYHYRLVASRTDGGGLQQHGKERVFTPAPALPPSVDATSSGGVTSTSVLLSAEINPNLAPTIYRFQYGTDTGYGSQTVTSESIGEDATDHSVSTELTGLTPGTLYHFRAVAINLSGPMAGPDQTFTTPDLPRIVASATSGVTENVATLTAQIKPGFRATTYHFVYGRTVSYGSRTSESSSIGADNAVHSVSSTVSGLSPAAMYHYRVIATNEIGSTEGPDMTFTTNSPPGLPEKDEKPVKCKRGFVKRHGKCVKRHHKRSHKHG